MNSYNPLNPRIDPDWYSEERKRLREKLGREPTQDEMPCNEDAKPLSEAAVTPTMDELIQRPDSIRFALPMGRVEEFAE